MVILKVMSRTLTEVGPTLRKVSFLYFGASRKRQAKSIVNLLGTIYR